VEEGREKIRDPNKARAELGFVLLIKLSVNQAIRGRERPVSA
jgi:hypothetical protein